MTVYQYNRLALTVNCGYARTAIRELSKPSLGLSVQYPPPPPPPPPPTSVTQRATTSTMADRVHFSGVESLEQVAELFGKHVSFVDPPRGSLQSVGLFSHVFQGSRAKGGSGDEGLHRLFLLYEEDNWDSNSRCARPPLSSDFQAPAVLQSERA